MSTIGGLSSSTSSSIRGYGGLASGLDRDSLIEAATAGTTTKIENKQKEKQKLEWKMEAIRGISDKLYDFTMNFASYTSPTNLIGSTLYGNNTITALGSNSGKVAVSGSSSMTKSMSITAVKQLAKNAQVNFNSNASNQTLVSDALGDLSTFRDFNAIADSGLTIKYGTKYYTVSLPASGEGYNYDTAEDVAESLQKAFGEVSIGSGKTLADVVSVQQSNGVFSFTNTDPYGNSISLGGQRNDLLEHLGFLNSGETVSNVSADRLDITASGLYASRTASLTERKNAAGMIGGKEVIFTYNGKTETITLPSGEELAKSGGKETLRYELQTQLDKAFGKGRIEVKIDDEDRLSFRTTQPNTNDGNGNLISDNSAVLEISGADRGIFGKYGVFKGISEGDSNRLNLNASLAESGLAGLPDGDWTDAEKEAWEKDWLAKPHKLKINGVEFEISATDTLQDIMNRINESDANVKMSYLKEADRFVLTSTQNGASGSVDIQQPTYENGYAPAFDIAEILFGKATTYNADGSVNVQGDYDVQNGQDAIMEMTYSGSGTPVEVRRDSNSFSLNGLDFTLKGTFQSDDADSEPITFDSTVDSQPAADAMKAMVEAFNEIIKLVNDEVSTKPNRKYDPLTADEEAELTESQAKAWTEKAKAGMLFNDTDIRSLASALRTVVSENSAELSRMGISVSSTYTDNGKLIFDERTFKKALEDDPEAVRKAFAGAAVTDEDGITISEGGLIVRMKSIMDRYASTTGATKGILIERAGSTHAPTSILSNSLQTQMDKIDDEVDDLLDKLETEQDRYISQFTTLEQLISQMNSQSSWLSSAFGG